MLFAASRSHSSASRALRGRQAEHVRHHRGDVREPLEPAAEEQEVPALVARHVVHREARERDAREHHLVERRERGADASPSGREAAAEGD